jgi:hypothetical protein
MELWYLIQAYSESVFEDLFREHKMLFLSETTFVVLTLLF